jgi:hypothetical protein
MASSSQVQTPYTERYVAFLDVLGFSAKVRRSAASAEVARALAESLDRIGDRWKDIGLKNTHTAMGDDFQAQSFSDCTVMSSAATRRGLEYFLLMVSQFCLDLMGRGLLVRGGIAKGLLYHTEKAVFGPAFLAAYDLEQRIASVPRVVVDKATHLDFEQQSAPEVYDQFIKPGLRHDDDGPVFVDVFAGHRILEGHIPSRVALNGKNIRATIQRELDDSIYDPAHYKKLQWLATYWNKVRQMRSMPGLEPIELPISREWNKLNNVP